MLAKSNYISVMVRVMCSISRNGKLYAVIIGLGLLLGGCYLEKIRYFEPSTSSGHVIGNDCRGHAGAPGSVRFDFGSAYVLVTTSTVQSRGVLSVLIHIPQDVTITFHEYGFIFSNGSETHKISPKRLLVIRYKPQYGIEELALVEGQPLPEGHYEIDINVPYVPDESFSFQFPLLYIDGSETPIPTVRFSKREGWFLMPLNC